MSKPVAVLIADVHYNIHTLPLADAAMRQAIAKAHELRVPLIVAGDLHDTKALMRAECVAAMLETFKVAEDLCIMVYVIVGNHDLQNEKGKAHALDFLPTSSAVIVDGPICAEGVGRLLPYYSSSDDLKAVLAAIPKGSTIICHQGVMGANMGHYIQDKTSLPLEEFCGFRIVSGHYHARQDICFVSNVDKVKRTVTSSTFSYIGNPFTLTFGEADDPEKGFQVLNDDGSLTFVPTNLRKHVILHLDVDNIWIHKKYDPTDLVWVKVTGPKSKLDALSKAEIAEFLGTNNFKLDKTPTDSIPMVQERIDMTGEELMDGLVDRLGETQEEKTALKDLWRTLA